MGLLQATKVTNALSLFIVFPDPNSKLNLLFGMFFGTDLADAAVEEVIVAHVEEGRSGNPCRICFLLS